MVVVPLMAGRLPSRRAARLTAGLAMRRSKRVSGRICMVTIRPAPECGALRIMRRGPSKQESRRATN